MQVGDRKIWERTFTNDDVRLFEQVSRDHGIQHVIPDEQGRLMVHDLLTATLPTKIGGELNFMARAMKLEFLQPVYVGDTVSCEVIVTQLEQEQQNTRLSATVLCNNQDGKTVLTGYTTGVIRKPRTMAVGLN